MKECHACGASLPAQARRCQACGERVRTQSIWTRRWGESKDASSTSVSDRVRFWGYILSGILFSLLFGGTWREQLPAGLELALYTLFGMIVIGLLSSLTRTGEKSPVEAYRNKSGQVEISPDSTLPGAGGP
jgi:hypothetical protein